MNFSDCIYTQIVLWLKRRKVMDIIEINKLCHHKMSKVCCTRTCVFQCVYVYCPYIFVCVSVWVCVCVCLRKSILSLKLPHHPKCVAVLFYLAYFFSHATCLPLSPTGIPLLGNLCPCPLEIADVGERFLQHLMQSI